MLISKMYLIMVLSFIKDLRFNVKVEHVPDGWVGGREGRAWWLPAGGIRASQGIFSSTFQITVFSRSPIKWKKP